VLNAFTVHDDEKFQAGQSILYNGFVRKNRSFHELQIEFSVNFRKNKTSCYFCGHTKKDLCKLPYSRRKRMKLSPHIRLASLLALTMLLFSKVNAQQTDALQPVSESSYDPIAATLDSLVNQNYIQRLSFATGGTQQNNFQPYEVPSYSDEVYAQRISKIQSPMALVYNQQVREYIDMYAQRKRALTERVMGLAQLYFPLFEQTLDNNDLPLEFKYLSIVESALNPVAKSRVGATGLWQFMLQTGKLYNLKVNSYIDERRDPVKSTQAACEYFKNMYAIYHDWLLVIASYNCGAGNVNKAIARSGGKTNFWEISKYLPNETRGYVPAFIAVTYLMNYSAEHNLNAVPPVISFYEADTVLVDQQVSLRDVAEVIDVPLDLLTYLNPLYKRGVIPEADEPQVLRLPTNKINSYLASLDKLYTPQTPDYTASKESPLTDYITRQVKKYHVVKRGEHLYSIADKYNCSINDIKRWNKFKGTKVYKGQRLMVYVSVKEKAQVSNASKKSSVPSAELKSADSALMASKNAITNTSTDSSLKNSDTTGSGNQTTDSHYTWYVVQKGDTLYSIARQYEGTVDEIKSMNNLSTNELKPGTKLKVKVSG
jgi:membrane-bound lytic murein transglycosylase D